jgi:uncharacterized tellurite resistance protein B-like protein
VGRLENLSYIEEKQDMMRIDTIKNLLAMALADRRMSQEEIQFLTVRCDRWGLSESELAHSIEYALTHQGELKIPPTKKERLELLGEMMGIMAADGRLVDAEKELFARAAVMMDISDEEVNDLITRLTRSGD